MICREPFITQLAPLYAACVGERVRVGRVCDVCTLGGRQRVWVCVCVCDVRVCVHLCVRGCMRLKPPWLPPGGWPAWWSWGAAATGNTEIETKQMCCRESTVSEVWYFLGFMYPYQIYRTKFS